MDGKCLWYSASSLFEQLTGIEDTRRLARNIAAEKSITNPEEQRQIEDTIRDFHDRIFSDKSIGLSTVVAHLHEDMSEDRLRIAEMFRRLNYGGTRLPTGTM